MTKVQYKIKRLKSIAVKRPETVAGQGFLLKNPQLHKIAIFCYNANMWVGGGAVNRS